MLFVNHSCEPNVGFAGNTVLVAMRDISPGEALTPPSEHVPIEELASRQGVEPVDSLDDLACPDLWDSDEEYERFLADLYASRRSGLA